MSKRVQSIANMQRGGAFLSEKSDGVMKPVGLKRYVAGGELMTDVADVVSKAANIWEENNRLEEQKNMLEADAVLKNYRNALVFSKSMDEFDEIAKGINSGVTEYFAKSSGGNDFMKKYGERLLSLNNEDVKKLRIQKEYDLGRNNLDIILANSQNLLQTAKGEKADILLSRGVETINNTSFLTDVEKNDYRDRFLRNGIYSIALQNVDEAKKQALKWENNVKDDLLNGIDEIEKIKIQEDKELEEKAYNDKYMGALNEAINLWQMKERGEIGKAEYKILSLEHNDYLWGDNGDNKGTLIDAYKIVRRINQGENVDVKEINNVSNYLIKGYKNNEIGFEEVANFQKQLLASRIDKKTQERLFDKEIDVLLDNVIGRDDFSNNEVAKIAMNEKAKMAFKVYDAYYGKKLALFKEFVEGGGSLTPKVERVLNKTVLNEVKNEFGFEEGIEGEFDYKQLKSILKEHYNGGEENEVWRKFYKDVFFVKDKKELLMNIAKRQMKKEIFYPSFDNWNDVLKADIEKGEKFYFKGRLAVKA